MARLLTLSDGVFAIALTLLALDLKVPDLAGNVSDGQLRHALAANSDSYWSFALTFYIIGGYWNRHRRIMHSVKIMHPALIRDSMILLFIVSAMPFPASLLGKYGGTPIALALYGAFSAAATMTMIVLAHDLRRLQPWQSYAVFVVFLLCIPAGYVLGSHGPLVLLLLLIPGRWRIVSAIFGWIRGRRPSAL